MTAIETLERAISKLETLRDGATPGEWSYRREVLGLRNTTILSGDKQTGYVAVGQFHEANAELIVALSRTVEPMLDILRFARALFGEQIHGEQAAAMVDLALYLARAILGEENDHA